jgi:septum site-determining protein MinC
MEIIIEENEIKIRIMPESTEEQIIEHIKENKEKILEIEKTDETLILIVGKELSKEEKKVITDKIKEITDIPVRYDIPEKLELADIKKPYEKDVNESKTKFYKGSLRSGQRVEFNGSIVVIGDVNAGSEVVATENIAILGSLRGVAHAGSDGNKKAIVTAVKIDAPQIRIANSVKDIKNQIDEIKKYTYAYIKDEEIVIE